MASLPEISKNTSVDDLLSKIMPAISMDMLANSNAPTELAGTEITMVVNVSGKLYNYILKNGAEVVLSESDINNAMMRLEVSEDDLKKMIQTGNLDMILGVQNDMNKAKYNALSSLKGSIVAEITNDDGSVIKSRVILNGIENPNVIFKMNAKDMNALMKKETNPANLFMSGAMKIEGDMGFAMSTQPLFS